MAAAARTTSQILIQSKKLSILSASASTSSRFVTTRNRSSKSEGGGRSLIEVNLETGGENEIVGMKRLDDAIYGIVVRRSAPDCVPPKKRPHGFAELIGKLGNPLYEDETLSLTNARGWPSTFFFIDGDLLHVYVDTCSIIKILLEVQLATNKYGRVVLDVSALMNLFE
ncbi:hypothetical protein MKX01_020275 [Papaver californicum]|nr:hypothetical protein MKX01_020275 [Papaver californicum]